ncbi:MAG TPA: hypothetical protein VMH61_08725 [Candidatus Acidoferrales bacterium]|nr:hypothetical protein [Candidatus Acidoferrales bacterium]
MNPTRRRLKRSSPVARSAGSSAADPRLIRLGRVRAAVRRIQSGYYDRADVRDRLVAAVLEELKGR